MALDPFSLSGHCRNRLRKLDLLFPTWTKINQTSSSPYPLKKRMCFQTRRHGNLRTRLVVFWPDLAKSPSVFTRVTSHLNVFFGLSLWHRVLVFVWVMFLFSWDSCSHVDEKCVCLHLLLLFGNGFICLGFIPFCLPEMSWVIGRCAVLFPNMLDLHSRRSSVSEAAEGATVMWQCLKS